MKTTSHMKKDVQPEPPEKKDALSVTDVEFQLADCRACDLSPWCESSNATQVTQPWGTRTPKLIIVAEAPGRMENQHGVPLVGPSGKFLDELLGLAGYDRDDVYLTNVVKCWPPVKQRKDGKNEQQRPTKKQIRTCTDLYLWNELEFLPRGVPIVTLGAVPLDTFIPGASLKESHGQLLEWEGRPLVAQYHPAFGLHSPRDRTTIEQDWASLNTKLEQQTKPWAWRQIDDWEVIRDQLSRATRVAFDYETTDLRPRIAEVVGVGICTDGDTGYYYTGPDRFHFLDYLKPGCELIAHNLTYEFGITAQALGDTWAADRSLILHDTMVMARLLGKELIGLKPLALSELGIRMKEFTDVVDGDIRDADPEKLAEYGALDVVATRRLFDLWVGSLDSREQGVYDLEISLVPAVAHIVAEGFKIDEDKLNDIEHSVREQLVRSLEEIQSQVHSRMQERMEVFRPTKKEPDRTAPAWYMGDRRVGPPTSISYKGAFEWKFNPASPAAVQAFFGIDSADEDNLLQLNNTLADQIREYKYAAKFSGSYVEPVKRSNGRLYGSFNAVGTDTGRFSASGYRLLDGTSVGINLQTAPPTIKPVFIADTDEDVLIDLDYSQIELRVLAHVADEEAMISAYRNGRDLHQEMMDRAGISDRRIAKVMNFSLAYNPEDRTAAYVLMRAGREAGVTINRSDADMYVSLYRKAWPGISDYYDEIIRQMETREYVETLLGRKWRATFLAGRSKIVGQQNWELLRKGVNHPIQGGAADIMKLALRDLWRSRPSYVRFKNTVHDSLVLQTKRSRVEETLLWAIPIMEQAYKLKVPIKVEADLKGEWSSSSGARPAGTYSLSKGTLQLEG